MRKRGVPEEVQRLQRAEGKLHHRSYEPGRHRPARVRSAEELAGRGLITFLQENSGMVSFRCFLRAVIYRPILYFHILHFVFLYIVASFPYFIVFIYIYRTICLVIFVDPSCVYAYNSIIGKVLSVEFPMIT
jgi:hypothetical protein